MSSSHRTKVQLTPTMRKPLNAVQSAIRPAHETLPKPESETDILETGPTAATRVPCTPAKLVAIHSTRASTKAASPTIDDLINVLPSCDSLEEHTESLKGIFQSAGYTVHRVRGNQVDCHAVAALAATDPNYYAGQIELLRRICHHLGIKKASLTFDDGSQKEEHAISRLTDGQGICLFDVNGTIVAYDTHSRWSTEEQAIKLLFELPASYLERTDLQAAFAQMLGVPQDAVNERPIDVVKNMLRKNALSTPLADSLPQALKDADIDPKTPIEDLESHNKRKFENLAERLCHLAWKEQAETIPDALADLLKTATTKDLLAAVLPAWHKILGSGQRLVIATNGADTHRVMLQILKDSNLKSMIRVDDVNLGEVTDDVAAAKLRSLVIERGCGGFYTILRRTVETGAIEGLISPEDMTKLEFDMNSKEVLVTPALLSLLERAGAKLLAYEKFVPYTAPAAERTQAKLMARCPMLGLSVMNGVNFNGAGKTDPALGKCDVAFEAPTHFLLPFNAQSIATAVASAKNASSSSDNASADGVLRAVLKTPSIWSQAPAVLQRCLVAAGKGEEEAEIISSRLFRDLWLDAATEKRLKNMEYLQHHLSAG